MTDTLPNLPALGLELPPSKIVSAALAFAKEHCNLMTYNHALRSAYWAAIIAKKEPSFSGGELDLELVVLGCVLHDMAGPRPRTCSLRTRGSKSTAQTLRVTLSTGSTRRTASTPRCGTRAVSSAAGTSLRCTRRLASRGSPRPRSPSPPAVSWPTFRDRISPTALVAII